MMLLRTARAAASAAPLARSLPGLGASRRTFACSSVSAGQPATSATASATASAVSPRKDEPRKVLLHSCCAPCSGAMIEEMVQGGHDVTVYFYNPNIHPKEEYEIRKDENKRYAAGAAVARTQHRRGRCHARLHHPCQEYMPRSSLS